MIDAKFKTISVNEIIVQLKMYKICFIKIIESSRYDSANALFNQIIDNINNDIIKFNLGPSNDDIAYARMNLTQYDVLFRRCLKEVYTV